MNVRPSNTEPLLRLNLEALSQELMERKRDEVLERDQELTEKPPFKFSAQTRVGFSDTDAQGIVYYGRYLPYFDLARVEYHRNLGLLGMDIGEEGEEFVMRACTIEYFAPAVFDDSIEVYVRIARIGRTSVTYEFAAYRASDDS